MFEAKMKNSGSNVFALKMDEPSSVCTTSPDIRTNGATPPRYVEKFKSKHTKYRHKRNKKRHTGDKQTLPKKNETKKLLHITHRR